MYIGGTVQKKGNVIAIMYRVPGTPQQNGHVEQKFPFSHVRLMLNGGNILILLAEAANTAQELYHQDWS